MLGANSPSAARFRPHLTVRGECRHILSVVFGEIDVARAVYRGTLALHVAPHTLVPRYARVMRLAAETLRDIRSEFPGSHA